MARLDTCFGRSLGAVGEEAAERFGEAFGGNVGEAAKGRLWHKGDIAALQQTTPHSITLSARASSEGGTVRLRALAVLRLITNSYLVFCSMGRSTGLAPLRIRPA